MTQVAKFVFSPFQENTYVLYDETKDCVIIDPGCYTDAERKELAQFIEQAGLKPVKLLNTHCHLDHIFGNKFVAEKYGIGLECHEGELPVLKSAPQVSQMYGVPMEASPYPSHFIEEGDVISFGNTKLETLLTPGHSPASICFYCRESNFLIAGDTLFRESIGRTDLPGGDHATLLKSIKEKIFQLDDDVRVYSGHMEATTIGYEKLNNPFVGKMQDSNKNPKRTDVNSLGEFGLIEHLTKGHQLKHASSFKGIGDDAAVLEYGDKCIVVSTDILAEGIHFDLMYSPLKHLGYKAVVVNVSDIYAMNAIPKQITVSMAISNRFSVEALEEIYAGIEAACQYYNVDLVGGDTTSSNKGLFLSITAIGEADKDKLVYRSGAKAGDILCVTGDLGAAYLGLQTLEREKQIYLSNPGVQPDLGKNDYIIGRQLKPEARKDMIENFMPKAGFVPTSMIDISDGLASELFHICKQSGVGAILEEGGVPIRSDVQQIAIDFKLDPITCALSGGEDYELLFTVSPDDLEKVKFMPDVYICGEMVDTKDGIKLHTKGGNIHPLKAQGWVHFGNKE